MPRLVYGVFPSREAAETAKGTLLGQALSIAHEREAATAAIHEYEVRPSDLPSVGNFSTRAALIGGIFVGGCVAVFLGLLMAGAFESLGGPSTIVGSGPIGVLLMSLAAGAFGGVVTGISGSAANRARVRQLEREVAKGKVLLTLEAPRNRVLAISSTMSSGGALQAGFI